MKYLVGERGPEMFVPSRKVRVISRENTERILRLLSSAGTSEFREDEEDE